MNRLEIKNLIIRSLNADADPKEAFERLQEEGINFGFRKGFADKILERISTPALTIVREVDFVRSMNFAFYRIALTGVAAIVILLISIFLMEGSLSLNSFIGLNNSYDESIVCLLTGN
jgi:hypothetical protein